MNRKVIRIGAIFLAAVLVILVALLFVEIDSPKMGRAALERAGAATGVRMTAEGFRLNLLRGLVLERVKAASSFPGGSFTLSLDRLVFEHRLLSVLLGRVAVDRIVLRQPRVQISEGGAPTSAPRRPSAAVAGAPPAGGLALQVSRIAIEDGSVRLQAPGQPATAITGLDLRLRDVAFDPKLGSPVEALSGEGEVRIKELAFATTHVREAEGQLRLTHGRLQTQRVKFRTDEGRFEAEMSVELGRLPLVYTLTLQGEPLDMNAIAGAGKGGGFGPGLLELKAEGVGTEPAGLSGRGRLRLEAGTLPSTPLLRGLERALGAHIVGSRYKATEAPFRMERGRVIFEGLRLEAEQVGLDAGGWASLEGPLEIGLAVRTPREGLKIQGVSDDVLDALTDEQGWVRVPFKVAGTQQSPRVWPDATALLEQAGRGGVKGLAQKAAGGLKGLFHKDQKKSH